MHPPEERGKVEAAMGEANVYSFEFDLIEFLRDQFDNVRLGMPVFEGDEHLWRATYVMLFGLNEVARYHRDRVELQIYCDSENLRFHAFSARAELLDAYRDVIRRVSNGQMDEIMARSGLPTEGDDNTTDHAINMQSIEYLLGKCDSLAPGPEAFPPPELASGGPTTILEISAPPGISLGRLSH
jgi:hypothetical protein